MMLAQRRSRNANRKFSATGDPALPWRIFRGAGLPAAAAFVGCRNDESDGILDRARAIG
jgi:hypothetical protein